MTRPTTWQLLAEEDSDEATPDWEPTGIPRCSDICPHHTGKRCRQTGNPVSSVCEPAVMAMGALLHANEGRARPVAVQPEPKRALDEHCLAGCRCINGVPERVRLAQSGRSETGHIAAVNDTSSWGQDRSRV